VYPYTPDDIDRKRAHHQAVKQDADDVPAKRRGNLGELAFEQFCREYLPVEMWEWENEEAIRKCNPESFSAYDFEVFGYEIDVKTSRDVSAFRPSKLLDQNPDDEIIVMVWHRDNKDGTRTARDLEIEVPAQVETQDEALEHLDAVVDAIEDDGGREPTEEELQDLGIDPDENTPDRGGLPDALT